MQLVKEEWERQLAALSFSSDTAIFQELDEIAGVSGGDTYTRPQILTFLRKKLWKIEELDSVEDTEVPPQPPSLVTPVTISIIVYVKNIVCK